jgi:hypothetical protein
MGCKVGNQHQRNATSISTGEAMLPEDLSPYMQLKGEGIARLVLCLLVEEILGRQLAAFRLKQLHPEPVEGEKELAVGRRDVMAIGDCSR